MVVVAESDYIRLELLPDGILVAFYKKHKVVTLEMAKEIVGTRLNFVGRVPRPVLIYNLGVLQMDKPARKYVSSGDGIAGIKAAAIIADKLSTYIIMGFIMSVERPPMPTRIFTRRSKAVAWLTTFL